MAESSKTGPHPPHFFFAFPSPAASPSSPDLGSGVICQKTRSLDWKGLLARFMFGKTLSLLFIIYPRIVLDILVL